MHEPDSSVACHPSGQVFRYDRERELHYRVYAQDGAPFLLLHGAGSSESTWGDVPLRLHAAGAHVITVDLPGHGRSSTHRGDYSLPATADALQGLLAHLDVTEAHLVGHSLGGATAVLLDLRNPDLARSVTLVAAGGLGKSAAAPLRAATLPGAEAALAAAFNPFTMRLARHAGEALNRVGVHAHPFDDDHLGSLAWLADRSRRHAFLATIRSVVTPRGQLGSALPHLEGQDGQRFMLIWGSEDQILPVGHAYRAHALLPGSTLHVFAGAGHEPHAYDPARFADALLRHAAGQDRP